MKVLTVLSLLKHTKKSKSCKICIIIEGIAVKVFIVIPSCLFCNTIDKFVYFVYNILWIKFDFNYQILLAQFRGIQMEKLDMLYEGKAKKVYKTADEDLFIVEYKDDATAFNGLKKGSIVGKGVINNKMTNIVFKYLEENGVETHLVEELSDRATLVKKVTIVPLEVIIRNVAAGSFSKKFGVEEGTPLLNPIVEFSYKNDELGDPMINNMQILAIGIAKKEDLDFISKEALKINELMKVFYSKRNINLIDFKIEFGRFEDKIILADEMSPDTCRLWDSETNEKLDKDRFRRDLGNVVEAYEEIFKRISK